MTRKDFEFIARVLREERDTWKDDPQTVGTIDRLTERFSKALAEGHPNFKPALFKAAARRAI